MIPILYGAAERSFTTTGIGRLSDATMCTVKEVRNGEFELEMKISTATAHFKDIQVDRIIYAIHDDTKDPQPFRIYKISRPIGGIITVYARHTSYDLIKTVVMPYEAASAVEALAFINSNAASGDGTTGFTFWTDITAAGTFSVDVPTSVRSVLGGMDGSILDTWHGEYEWDKFTVKLHAARGTDNGVVISYGKNLIDVKKETDASSIWTRLVPYWEGQSSSGADKVVTLTEKYIDAPNAGEFETVKTRTLDLSEKFDSEPTKPQLRAAAQRYAQTNAKSEAPTSLKVSFVALWQTEEYAQYASLQRLRLCDVVTVRHEELGVDDKLEIVETVYNVLTERYDSMTLGEAAARFGNTVEEAAAADAKASTVSKSFVQSAVHNATEVLRGGMGGHILIATDANGDPHEIYAMDTADTQTATKVLRINMNGIGFSKNGFNGPYDTAWTIDGDFVADFITTGVLNAALITAGYMQADRIQGGTLTLGGANNQNGVLRVLNSSGLQIGSWDKDGATITGDLELIRNAYAGTSLITKQGQFTITDASGSLDGTTSQRAAYGLETYINETRNVLYLIPSTDHPISGKYNAGIMSKGQLVVGSGMSGDIGGGNLSFFDKFTWLGHTSLANEGYSIYLGEANARLGYSETSGSKDIWKVVGNLGSGMSTSEFSGYLTCTGGKNRLISTDHYGNRLLYCYEMPEAVFGDSGEGVVGEDGQIEVILDDIFRECARTDIEYQVFLQKEGEGDLWIDGKEDSYFTVKGTPGLKFAWEIKAKQKDLETARLDINEEREDSLKMGSSMIYPEAIVLEDEAAVERSIAEAFEDSDPTGEYIKEMEDVYEAA